MTADFPYLSRAYNHVPPAPPMMLAATYTPNGGGSPAPEKNRATMPAEAMADMACTKISIPGAYHG